MPVITLSELGCGNLDVCADPLVLVVHDYEVTLLPVTVDVGEDGFLNTAHAVSIVDVEVLDTAEEVTLPEQGEDLPVVL